MFIVYSLMLVFGLIFLSFNPKDSKYRWICFALFTCVIGGLVAHYVKETFGSNMLLKEYYKSSSVKYLPLYLLDTYSYYFFPYSFLMFSMTYALSANTFFLKHKNKIYLIFLMPIILFYVFFNVYPEVNPNLIIIVVWASIYIILSNSFLIYSYIKADIKAEALIVCITLIPGTSLTIYTDYILVLCKNFSIWNYHDLIAFVSVLIAIILAMKYGIMGIKIRIEKKDIETSMKPAYPGISIINHSLKSEISKISMCADSIQENNIPQNDIIQKSVIIIRNSLSHLSNLMNKTMKNTRDIILSKKLVSLKDIIDSAINLNEIDIKQASINIFRNYDSNIRLLCDETHTIEVINNVLRNSIEAIGENGEIRVSTGTGKKFIFIKIQDTGIGIPSNKISSVTLPFFTTKSKDSNFGLGLSYCYNVMKKHNGFLEISSNVGHGTSVSLYFPIHRHKYTGK